MRDSVLNDEKRTGITRKEIQFAFEKKEALAVAEISRQRLVKKCLHSRRNDFIIDRSLGINFLQKKRDTHEKIKEMALNAEVMDTEMKALRAQINPHFIFKIDMINKMKKTRKAVVYSDLEKGIRVEVRLPLQLSF